MYRKLPVALAVALAVAFMALAVPSQSPVATAQGGGSWNSATIWRPSLAESGDALAELVNQIDAACSVDVDSIVAANGAGPEGAVYAFLVTWTCPSGLAETPDATWASAMVWQPNLGDAGNAVAEIVNQIDATCSVDVDPVSATSGSGPEGPVYAFAITWAC